MRVGVLISAVFLALAFDVQAEDLHFSDGRIWLNVKVLSRGANDVLVMHDGEVWTVRAQDLKEEERARLGLRLPVVREIQPPRETLQASPIAPQKESPGSAAPQERSKEAVGKRRLAVENPESACIIMSSAIGVGTGFVLQRDDSEFVLISNQHVISGGAPHRYERLDGSLLKPLGGWLADDRDLVMFRLDDVQDSFFELEPDVDAVALGENVVIYGNSTGEGMRLSRAELVRKTTSEIEVSGGIVPGNSGGPILREKTRRVIGVSTYVTVQSGSPATIEDLIKAALMPKVRCFGVRIDTVGNPAEFDFRRFIAEGAAVEADAQRMR